MHERPIGEAFVLMAELAEKLGSKPMKDLPGLWEHKIPGVDGGEWWWAVNGHEAPLCPTDRMVKVPFGHCYLEWNGWPAGIFTPFGGEICAGSMANEDTFIAALKAAIAELTAPADGPQVVCCACGKSPVVRFAPPLCQECDPNLQKITDPADGIDP